VQHAILLQQAVVRLAPSLLARRGLWHVGLMRVLKVDDMPDGDQRLFTQPLALARLGRYIIDMHRVRLRVFVLVLVCVLVYVCPCVHVVNAVTCE
jgi:hypothetical protein